MNRHGNAKWPEGIPLVFSLVAGAQEQSQRGVFGARRLAPAPDLPTWQLAGAENIWELGWKIVWTYINMDYLEFLPFQETSIYMIW